MMNKKLALLSMMDILVIGFMFSPIEALSEEVWQIVKD